MHFKCPLYVVHFSDDAVLTQDMDNDKHRAVVLTKFAPVTSEKDRPCGLIRTWSCSLFTRTCDKIHTITDQKCI